MISFQKFQAYTFVAGKTIPAPAPTTKNNQEKNKTKVQFVFHPERTDNHICHSQISISTQTVRMISVSQM
jgi:hypothetical protein